MMQERASTGRIYIQNVATAIPIARLIRPSRQCVSLTVPGDSPADQTAERRQRRER